LVASSLVSPDHGVQRYRLGPSSSLRRYSDSRLIVLFLWAMPLETAPLLFRDLDSQLLVFPFSFRLLVLLMMTTKVVFLRGSACAFLVCTGTWPRDLLVPQSWLTQAEPRQCRLPGLGMPS